MYLDEILAAQKRAEAKGITSVCSAHPLVLRETLKVFKFPLVEATCNQVNQFGGYTGMTPNDFVAFIRRIAEEDNFPSENIILGGDHLGPNVWQNESADSAMSKSKEMIRDYVKAGFIKIHLDCSMRLADDPPGALDPEIIARRTAQLAKIAEESVGSGLFSAQMPRYVIGSEVPMPGGATNHEDDISVTKVETARQTLDVSREAFQKEGLQSAWERVIALVVQPGVEFGDDFVLPYQPEKSKELSQFIESQPMVYEAHSTDYQTSNALKNLVSDHFAILKVGPSLTYAFREVVFALAMMEKELLPSNEASNIISVLDDVMLKRPEHWLKYYHGSESEQAFKRKYSLSDRIRYYWTEPSVQHAMKIMLTKLTQNPLPLALLKKYVPDICAKIKDERVSFTPEQILLEKIKNVLEDYYQACDGQ
jgi:D-tagatose-1,6-bisphosphate aldolase subunit GatZ/KbaZ